LAAPLLVLVCLALPGLQLRGLAASAAPPPSPPPVDITTLADQVSLTPHLAYLRDPGGELTAAAAAAEAEQFVPFGTDVPNFGFAPGAFWVRVQLSNPLTATIPVILHLETASTAFADLYVAPGPGSTAPAVATGVRRPYDTRPIPGRGFAFPLDVPPGGTTDYYLRVQSDLPVNLAMALWTPAAFAAALDQDEIRWGIVLGMLLLMSTYNLLLFIALRDGKHLLLCVFGFSVALSSAMSGGYLSRWLPAADLWGLQAILTTALVIAMFVALAIAFLELRRHLRGAFWLLAATLLMLPLGVAMGAFGSYQAAYALLIGLLLPILLTIFVATLIRVRQGSRLALFLLLGQTLPIVFGILQAATALGFGPRLPALPLLVPVNSLLLLVIMSLALADQINLLRKQTDVANAALKASEQRLNTYLDALPFNIQVHDAQLKPLYVNAQIRKGNAEQRAGFYEEEYPAWVAEFPVTVSSTGEPYPTEQLPLMRAARGEEAHADDVTVNLPHGPTFVEAWAVPLKDEHGSVTAIVTAFQDISARRAVENELADYRERLEQRVAQRTAELAALNASLGARVAELTAINDVGRHVARISDLHATLDEVAEILTDVFEVAGVVVGLYDHAHSSVELVALADRHDGRLLGFRDRIFPYNLAAGYSSRQQAPVVFDAPEELLGISPEIHAMMRQIDITRILVAPLVARDQHMGTLALLSADGDRVFTADELRVAQTIAGQVATAIDTLQLIDDARRQRDVAEALRQTATALSRNLDQQNVFGTILEQLDRVFACEGAALALVAGEELVTVAAKGLSAGCLGRRVPLADHAASLTVLHGKRPLVVNDTRTSSEAVCCAETQPIRSWLGAPLISGAEALGVLSLDSIEPQGFTDVQAELLATFADQAAIAVTNAKLYSQAQEMAVAAERTRLARDLHDAVTQTIFSASLLASTLPLRLQDAALDLPPAAAADLDALQMLTKGALAEMRTLLLELRPEHLAEVPLDLLLTQLAQAFTGRTGVPATVDANCDPAMAPPFAVKIAFYRVAQEALNNIAKHARAACVTMRYSTRGGSVRLAVLDDGQGFAVETVGPERLGLAIMRERAAAAGAQLTIDSEPGLGTHLFMVWNEDRLNNDGRQS
jgi:signal transduction histidine kinase/PAS domain-containing protein